MGNTFHFFIHYLRRVEPLPFGRMGIQLLSGGLCLNRLNWDNHRAEDSDPYWRIYLPMSGEIRLHFAQETCKVLPGNLYLIPPEQDFRLEGIKPCSHYWFHFNCSSLQLIPDLDRPISISDEHGEYRELLRRMLKLALHAKNLREVAEFHQIPVLLVASLLDNRKLAVQKIGRSAIKFAELKAYIEKNLTRNLHSRELARLSGLPLPVFTSQFRKKTGLPPKQYISVRRINRAKHLLITTDEPIKNIAAMSGYTSLHLFYRLFKKYVLSTPEDFRVIRGGGIKVE